MEEVKLTLQEVRDLHNALASIENKEISVKTSYWIGRLINDVATLLKPVDSSLSDLRRKHGTQDKKNPAFYSVDPKNVEAMAKFQSDVDILFSEEVSIRALDLSLLIDEEVKISSKAMSVLRKVFIDFESKGSAEKNSKTVN